MIGYPTKPQFERACREPKKTVLSFLPFFTMNDPEFFSGLVSPWSRAEGIAVSWVLVFSALALFHLYPGFDQIPVPSLFLRSRSSGPPTLSIVIPIFNSEATLEKAIMSCVTQRYTDYELVCVLDGSTDGSEALLGRLAARLAIPIVIARHEECKGLLLARRTGLFASTGRFVMSLDPDDVFVGEIFEAVAAAHAETGADVILVQMMLSVNGGLPRLWLYRKPPKNVLNNQELRNVVINGSTMWNRVILSIERKLNIRAFDMLSVRFRGFLFQEEDRLQAYVASFYAKKFVYLPKVGYLYYEVKKKRLPSQFIRILRQAWDVREFLQRVYQADNMVW
jgi:glycosyltransferase involved in cell wall biosynthesis